MSYNIILSYQNGTELPYLCGIISRPQLTNEYLVKSNPGESITHTQDSNCWELSRGEYSLVPYIVHSLASESQSPIGLAVLNLNRYQSVWNEYRLSS